MRVRKLIGTAVVLFVLMVGFHLTASFHRLWGPFYYSSDPIRARVIDESTARPVEAWKALIAGYERLPKDSRLHHSHPTDYLAYMREGER